MLQHYSSSIKAELFRDISTAQYLISSSQLCLYRIGSSLYKPPPYLGNWVNNRRFTNGYVSPSKPVIRYVYIHLHPASISTTLTNYMYVMQADLNKCHNLQGMKS